MSSAHEPRLNVLGSSAILARASSEFLQIVVLRRQDDGCPCDFVLPVADECNLVALHRAVEIVEIRVLAEARGISARGIGIGLGADDRRLLCSLGADRAGFLQARGA